MVGSPTNSPTNSPIINSVNSLTTSSPPKNSATNSPSKNNNGIVAPSEFKILLFEASMQPVDSFNREHLNPSAWLTLNNYTPITGDDHKKQSTAQVYVKCDNVQQLIWDQGRVDVPRFVVGVYDIETTTKTPKVEDENEKKKQNTAPPPVNKKRKAPPLPTKSLGSLFQNDEEDDAKGVKKVCIPGTNSENNSGTNSGTNKSTAETKPQEVKLPPQVLTITIIVTTVGGPNNMPPTFKTVCFTWKPSNPIEGVDIRTCKDEADLLRKFHHFVTYEED